MWITRQLAVLALFAGTLAFGQDGDLIYSAQQGDLAAVNALLKSGTDANTQRSPRVSFRTTALIQAAANGHADVAKALLAAGADVNAQGISKPQGSGGTALMVASQEGKLEVVQALLAAKAEVNENDLGRTALTFAIHFNHAEVVKALLAAGANVTPPERGEAPLSTAARVQGINLEIVKALLAAKADPDSKTEIGATPLMTALGYNRLDVALALVKAGAKVTTPGLTPLMIAAEKSGPGSLELVQAILAAHADVNTGFDGQPQNLGPAGASLNTLTMKGTTPLGIAAASGSVDIVQTLLAPGVYANVNARQHNEETPLTLAAMQGRSDVVRLLLAAKADVNVKNEAGFTALGLALKNNHPDVAAILRSAGAVE